MFQERGNKTGENGRANYFYLFSFYRYTASSGKKTRQKTPDEYAVSVVLQEATYVSIANNFYAPVSEGDSQITFKQLIAQLILIPETV